MSTLGLLLFGLVSLAILGISSAWVLAPLWRGGPPAEPSDPRALALLERREALLASLRDLEDDHRDGLVDARSHASLRADLLRRGGEILAALDRLADERAGESSRLGAELETEIAALLGDAGSSGARSGDAVSAGHAAAATGPEGDNDPQGGAGQARACVGCGRRLAADARFCDACGQAQ